MNWQELIDDVYEYWQNNDVDYGDVLRYANSTFGEIGELAVLLKNYNYQVENGGHQQYFDNGYCQSETGFFVSKDYDIPLHHRMIDLFEFFELHKTDQGKPVHNIMSKFYVLYEPEYYEEYDEICDECGGYGYLDDDGNETCPSCFREGCTTEEELIEEQVTIDSSLDDDYCEVNQAFIEYFETVLSRELDKGDTIER